MFIQFNAIQYLKNLNHTLVIKNPPSYGTLRSLEASLNPQLTKYARETEISISMARKENRILLFYLCPMQPASQDIQYST